MNRTYSVCTLCLLSACVLFAVGSADAATVAYYRFEDGPGFTNDSAGTRHLSNSGAVQTNLPASGRGSRFSDPGPWPFAANTNAAEYDGGDLMDTGTGGGNLITTDRFTVEALIHMDSVSGGREVAAQWDTANKRSWIVRIDGGVLQLFVSGDGSDFESETSGITLLASRDYFIAVTYSNGAAEFWVRNLTDEESFQASKTFTTHTTVLPTDQLVVGSQAGGANKIDGLIDEVRISDVALATNEFLVSPHAHPLGFITQDTAVYYRFEDSPGFTSDSSGHAWFDLDNTSVVQTNIPASGRGSAFPNPVPQTGAANSDAADFTTGDLFDTGNTSVIIVESNFTAEAFINPTEVVSRGNIVSMWDHTVGERSLMFSVEANSLSLFLSETGSDGPNDSAGFSILANKDYFVAVTFDQTDQANGIVFYATNLTDGGALQVSTASHSIVSLNTDDRLTLGATAGGGNDFLGFMDEVRLSRRVLSYSEMLISSGTAFGTVVIVK
ncbi:MAG: LamG domain-containing protein [Lentisphaerae bacterium]|nr:LamG domain-containing protein [Lentisphaerota bacterium]